MIKIFLSFFLSSSFLLYFSTFWQASWLKTKAEIEEIALVEKEYNNLKQRADELEVQLNHEREQNAALMQGRSTKMQETASEKTTL